MATRILYSHIFSKFCHGIPNRCQAATNQILPKQISFTAVHFNSADVPAIKESDEIIVGTKKTKRKPFVKDLFIGRFDTDMLTYPEILNKEQHETTEHMFEVVDKYFSEQVDSRQIDIAAKIPEETLKGLAELGLFGLQIPISHGGLELNATQYARIQEAVGRDGSIATTLAAHQAIGLKGILMYGNDSQKDKYLPKLATGEQIAAFCLTEASSGSDAASIQSIARLSPDGKTYHLSGTKMYISNGGLADVFTVFARTSSNPNQSRITAFIVEKAFGNVTIGKPEDKLGIRGSNTTSVTFDETPIPVENVLGNVGEGFKIAVNILNSGRFSMGGACAGALRKSLGIAVEHAIEREQFGKPLKDFQLIQKKITDITVAIYAMESLAYLTAGEIDRYDSSECAVEAAIVKVFSSEACFKYGSECLQIMGGMGYMKELPFERNLRDSRILLIFEGTNEVLRLFIALMGIQHAGAELSEYVRKFRNPFLNPQFMFTETLKRMRASGKNPPLTMKLYGYLHPSMIEDSNRLERCTQKFQSAVETLLQRSGQDVVTAQIDLCRVANIAIDLYAMTAVLGRASRSYCIGLRNSDMELMIARLFCGEAEDRIQVNAKELIDGPTETGDKLCVKVAEYVLQNKGYCAAHPLARNWF